MRMMNKEDDGVEEDDDDAEDDNDMVQVNQLEAGGRCCCRRWGERMMMLKNFCLLLALQRISSVASNKLTVANSAWPKLNKTTLVPPSQD